MNAIKCIYGLFISFFAFLFGAKKPTAETVIIKAPKGRSEDDATIEERQNERYKKALDAAFLKAAVARQNKEQQKAEAEENAKANRARLARKKKNRAQRKSRKANRKK